MNLKNVIGLMVIIFALLIIFGCAAQTKFADYQPVSDEQAEVVQFMKECEKVFLDKNIPKWLECIHDDAEIRISVEGANRSHPWVKKPEYVEWIKINKDKMSHNELINPKISITGDSATFKAQHREGQYMISETHDLIKENGEWKIIRLNWTWR